MVLKVFNILCKNLDHKGNESHYGHFLVMPGKLPSSYLMGVIRLNQFQLLNTWFNPNINADTSWSSCFLVYSSRYSLSE